MLVGGSFKSSRVSYKHILGLARVNFGMITNACIVAIFHYRDNDLDVCVCVNLIATATYNILRVFHADRMR